MPSTITCSFIFRLALKGLVNSSLFEGKEYSKIFAHNLQKLEEQQYRLAGRLTAMSIAQEGPGLYVLNPLLYSMMIGQEVDFMDFDLDCFADHDIRNILQKVHFINFLKKVLIIKTQKELSFN